MTYYEKYCEAITRENYAWRDYREATKGYKRICLKLYKEACKLTAQAYRVYMLSK